MPFATVLAWRISSVSPPPFPPLTLVRRLPVPLSYAQLQSRQADATPATMAAYVSDDVECALQARRCGSATLFPAGGASVFHLAALILAACAIDVGMHHRMPRAKPVLLFCLHDCEV